MQMDKDLLEEIKNSIELKPRPDFVNKTKKMLIAKANKNSKLSRLKRNIKYTLTTAAVFTFIMWLSFFNGTEHVVSSYQAILSSLNQNKSINFPADSSEPTVFIYQTHSTESFTPLLNTDTANEAFDDEINITMVGKKIADLLERKGISTLHDDSNISQQLISKGLEYYEAYSVSGEIVKNALDKHESIKLVLDIHRDSRDRKSTTVRLNGIEVPKISLVISKNNSNYKENLKTAEIFHEILEDKYPGLSTGITMTEGPDRGIYNQDLFPNALLIQIGGVDNTLDEEYRGAGILSDVIADVLVEME